MNTNETDDNDDSGIEYDLNAAIDDLRPILDGGEIPRAPENRSDLARELWEMSHRLYKLAREADDARTRERVNLLSLLANVEANRADATPGVEA